MGLDGSTPSLLRQTYLIGKDRLEPRNHVERPTNPGGHSAANTFGPGGVYRPRASGNPGCHRRIGVDGHGLGRYGHGRPGISDRDGRCGCWKQRLFSFHGRRTRVSFRPRHGRGSGDRRGSHPGSPSVPDSGAHSRAGFLLAPDPVHVRVGNEPGVCRHPGRGPALRPILFMDHSLEHAGAFDLHGPPALFASHESRRAPLW